MKNPCQLLFFAGLTFALTLSINNLIFAASNSNDYQNEKSEAYQELVDLYEEFRDSRFPAVDNGVPDYSPEAMERQYRELKEYREELASIDTTGWEISRQVDYRTVEIEMNALKFEHKVKKPWKRDPAFYAVINFQFGPKMHQSMSIPSLPLDEEQQNALKTQLEAIPVILQQARENLTVPIADLAYVAIYTKQRQIDALDSFISELRDMHDHLVGPAVSAKEAIREFRQWLKDEKPNMENGAGVGVNNYNWYLENVALIHYTFDEIMTLLKREYQRAVAGMNLKKHKYRQSPELAPAENQKEYLQRYNNAMDHYFRFQQFIELFTMPNYIEAPPLATGWTRDEERDYFQHVLDRYPLPLTAHGRGHSYDALHRAHDDRPIRGESRLYFVDGPRQEAFAIGQEKFLYYLGLVDHVPGANEVMYHLKTFRAARAIAELKMHSNELTFEEAFQYTIDKTPYEWIPDDSPTLWHDLELYLRSPLYGIGYVIGPIQIEQLMTDAFLQNEEEFHLTEFMDEFLDAGILPMSLISLEMTGQMKH